MHLSRLIRYYFLLKEMMVNPETPNWPKNIEEETVILSPKWKTLSHSLLP